MSCVPVHSPLSTRSRWVAIQLATHDPHLLRTVTGRQIALRAGRLMDGEAPPES